MVTANPFEGTSDVSARHRSAVTPHLARSNTQRTKLSTGSSVLSSVSDNERWKKAYGRSESLKELLSTLRRGESFEPFVLSDDGLLYIYVEEEGNDMEVPRLVPPEGRIRRELFEDALWDVEVGSKGKKTDSRVRVDRVRAFEKLSDTYWWDTMRHDVLTKFT